MKCNISRSLNNLSYSHHKLTRLTTAYLCNRISYWNWSGLLSLQKWKNFTEESKMALELYLKSIDFYDLLREYETFACTLFHRGFSFMVIDWSWFFILIFWFQFDCCLHMYLQSKSKAPERTILHLKQQLKLLVQIHPHSNQIWLFLLFCYAATELFKIEAANYPNK